MLPKKKTPKKNDLRDLTILMYGRPKVGKSTWASHADGALFLATEPGLNHVEVFQVPVSNWEEVLVACKDLAAGGHGFSTVVIDTVGNAHQMCMDYVCAKNGWAHPADAGYGKGWTAVGNEWKRVLTKLAALPYGLIMVAHDKPLTDERTGAVKMIPALSGSAREAVVALADLVLYAETERIKVDGEVTERRVVRTKPTTGYEAGDRTGRLPDPLPLDWSAFVAAFNGGDK